ncbi:MAG: beta-hydroxyacyl-ACP dehydratase [Pirellulaceae bacterium]|nr:beta-hydroxyacyl-ACP dehydratase [Pirellulaceae bacterium]
MRWFWFDRYLEFVSKSHAVSVKNVCMAEPYVIAYSKKSPNYPSSLVIEGMAQTAGLLLNQTFDFKKKVVLAKIGKSKFFGFGTPGDQLMIRAEIENMQEEGAVVSCTCHCQDRLLASADLMFAYLDERFKDVSFFDDAELISVLRNLHIFDIGKNKDGSPIEIPAHFLQAEQELIQTVQDHS